VGLPTRLLAVGEPDISKSQQKLLENITRFAPGKVHAYAVMDARSEGHPMRPAFRIHAIRIRERSGIAPGNRCWHEDTVPLLQIDALEFQVSLYVAARCCHAECPVQVIDSPRNQLGLRT